MEVKLEIRKVYDMEKGFGVYFGLKTSPPSEIFEQYITKYARCWGDLGVPDCTCYTTKEGSCTVYKSTREEALKYIETIKKNVREMLEKATKEYREYLKEKEEWEGEETILIYEVET